MHSRSAMELYATLERLGTLFRRRLFGESEAVSSRVAMSYLFYGVWRSGETRMRMTDISRALAISKPAATQAVNRMVEQGLVARVNDARDRRVVYVQATEAGRKQFEGELERIFTVADRVVLRMGEADAARLNELLGRFFDALTAETEE